MTKKFDALSTIWFKIGLYFFVDNLGWLELARAAAILSQPFNSETLTKQRKNQQH